MIDLSQNIQACKERWRWVDVPNSAARQLQAWRRIAEMRDELLVHSRLASGVGLRPEPAILIEQGTFGLATAARAAYYCHHDIRGIFVLRGKEKTVEKVVPEDVRKTFEDLSTQWRRETVYISSFTKIVMNPSYQRIIGMGPAVVPLLLQDLERAPKHWFWALASITRENPVKDEDAGDMGKMAKAWLDWGRMRGYV